MSSLANCLKKHNIPKPIADRIVASADNYRAEGYKGREANQGAIRDIIDELEQEHKDILGQIKNVR